MKSFLSIQPQKNTTMIPPKINAHITMKRTIKPSLIMLLALAGSIQLFIAGGLSAAVVVEDTFTGTAGTTINGRMLPTWNPSYYSSAPSWNASGRVILTASNSATINETATSGGAVVPFLNPEINGGSVTVQGNIVTGTANYVGLSLLGNDSTNFFSTDNPLFLTLHGNGAVVLYKNGGTNIFAQGIAGFSQTTAYKLALQYTFATASTGTAVIFVNDSQFASVAVSGLNSASVSGTGFYLLVAQTGSTTIDNFQTSAIPEPSTLALLVGVGAMTLLATRRSRCK